MKNGVERRSGKLCGKMEGARKSVINIQPTSKPCDLGQVIDPYLSIKQVG